MRTSRAPIANIDVDNLPMAGAKSRVEALIQERRFALVVTPNLDHLTQLRSNPELLGAYRLADLVVADGLPVVWLSWLTRNPLKCRVTGVDLFTVVCEQPRQTPLRVFLLGADERSSEAAAAKLETGGTGVRVVGRYAGSVPDGDLQPGLGSQIAASRPDVVAVCLGCPKQEKWVVRNRDALPPAVYMCLGATLDFMAGSVPRAPSWMRAVGLEWLHRLKTEPARMGGRYLRDLMAFPSLALLTFRRRTCVQTGSEIGAYRK